jgi:lipopolysaccharide transport system ATP-binding protein
VGFHPSLSGRENVFLNAAIYGIRQAEISQHFDELVKFAGLEEFIDTPVSRYSSGMYLRLAFSTAIHMEPDILLADEVLAVGDLNFQEKCLERVQQEGDAGKIVLFVSHDMAAITRLCHEVIWLEAGQIVDRGKPEEIVARYQDSVWKPRAVKLGKRGNQGHEQVRIISVGLRSQEGTEIGSARLSEDFFITILFEVDGKNMKARPSFDLYTHNVLVLRTGLWEEIPIAEPGAYAAQARIPRCFLVDTIYSVNVSIRIEQDGGLTSVKVHNALSFRVYDDEALATERRGSREGPARGVVAPRLEWDWRKSQTDKV